VGRDKVSTSAHFSHLCDTMAQTLALNTRRINGRGQNAYIVTWSQSPVCSGTQMVRWILVGCYLGSCSQMVPQNPHHLRGAMWFPWDDYSCSRVLVIAPASDDGCPLGDGLSCETYSCLGSVSVLHHNK
jgi:hypothetical protein